ncbi:MAG: heme-binding protein [bacterium]|nr:heme-binding protein [bacterium]
MPFSSVWAEGDARLPTHAELVGALVEACKKGVNNGAIFSPAQMWAAIVDRSGQVVAVAKTPGADPWPGSRPIAMQKANTANAFSNRNLALSTANLYSAVQPGGSLYGLQHSNPVNVAIAYGGKADKYGTTQDPAVGKRVGGINVFGGGLPLYHQRTGEVLGAIGVSGDSSCADHVIAWRVRHTLGFRMLPGGVNKTSYGGASAPQAGDDNIIYAESGFRHPACGFKETSVNDLPSVQNLTKPVASKK